MLVPLGRLVLARGEEACAEDVARVRAAVGAARPAFEAAVREELSLACAEHIQGTDPRALGGEPPAALWREVLEADRRVQARRPRPDRPPG